MSDVQTFIKAKFIGEKLSLGYMPQHVYTLAITHNKPYRDRLMYCWIERLNGNGRCPYETKESFEKNWLVEGLEQGSDK